MPTASLRPSTRPAARWSGCSVRKGPARAWPWKAPSPAPPRRWPSHRHRRCALVQPERPRSPACSTDGNAFVAAVSGQANRISAPSARPRGARNACSARKASSSSRPSAPRARRWSRAHRHREPQRRRRSRSRQPAGPSGRRRILERLQTTTADFAAIAPHHRRRTRCDRQRGGEPQRDPASRHRARRRETTQSSRQIGAQTYPCARSSAAPSRSCRRSPARSRPRRSASTRSQPLRRDHPLGGRCGGGASRRAGEPDPGSHRQGRVRSNP